MVSLPADTYVDRNELLPLIGPVKRSGEWLMAFCPAHDDGSKHGGNAGQSLGLSDTGVLRCFAGCDFKDIMEKLRGPALIRPAPLRDTSERLVKVYAYTDEDGVVLAEKGRFETASGQKTFRWRLPGSEGWKGGVDLKAIPLYGVAMLTNRPNEPVYFVEGEKACEACWEQGLLAVTHGGGAGIKDFGHSLEVLRGRTVYLWADNDPPGAAYMALVGAKLAVLDVSLRMISVALPPKGDAYDYFAGGGTTIAIESSSPSEPSVQILAEDTFCVSLPTVAGMVAFTFSDMDKRQRQFDATISVRCFADPEPYSENINLNSSSGKTQFRRDLDALFGKQYDWTRNLNKAINLATEAYLSQERGCDIVEIPDSVGEVMLIPPLVVADGPTIFFGDGASLKSYITGRLMVSMSLGIDFCGMKTPNMVPMLIDYEDSGPNTKRRWKRIALGIDPDLKEVTGVHYWEAKGIALADQIDGLQRYITRHGIGLLVIDSAAPACGGDPVDTEAVLRFFSALKKLGLPSIIIAHVTKALDTTKPFGSSFWHYEARRTWYVERQQEEDSDDVDVGFYNRKVNDGRKPFPIAFHAKFSEDERGPVYIDLASMNAAPEELLARAPAAQQIWAALSRPMTITEIMEKTGLAFKTVEKALSRGTGRFVRTGDSTQTGGKPAYHWARLAV